jgi:uncharacterized membrane protein YtjA (UPF0391 family)
MQLRFFARKKESTRAKPTYKTGREIFILQIVLFAASLLCEKKKSTRAKPAYQARREIFFLQIVLFAASLLCAKKKRVQEY